jgi:hypothetical protein
MGRSVKAAHLLKYQGTNMTKNSEKIFLMITFVATSSAFAMESTGFTPTPFNSPEKATMQIESQIAFDEWQQRNYEFRSMSERGDFVVARSKKRTASMKARALELQQQEAIKVQEIQQVPEVVNTSSTVPFKSLENVAQRAKKTPQKNAKPQLREINAYDKSMWQVKKINAFYDEFEQKQQKHEIRKNTLHPETLKFPSGRAVEFVRAVKKGNIEVVVEGLKNPELNRLPLVELLKPVYENKSSEIWVSENLLRQASYSEIAATAGALALKSKNIPFMKAYAQEMKAQVTRKQNNLPVYRICNS